MLTDTALIFVLNRKYVRPLKVLLFSLAENASLQDCPIIVVTDDERVAKDPFIRRVAERIELMDQEGLSVFSSIRGEKIAEKSRVAFAPKYTFLKFMTFLERGFKRHIFIDADMLCMSALDEALLTQPYDVKAMKEVPSSKFPIREESRAKFDREEAIRLVFRADKPQENAPGTGINSGFMVLQDRAISNSVFELAIEVASSDAYAAEQPATSEVIRRIDGGRFLEMPIWYNARRRVFECLGPAFFLEHQESIKLLHFTPGKPWVLGSRDEDFLDRLWLDWEDRSRVWVQDRITAGASI
ncbi:glycosyltransferase [Brevundimonas sp.]|uniref:glycosyltransferase n=1 Tax=Brevundimonas sp. TaxID=1871086 RepID=UPI0028B22C18|nr:glycosyltransferase [Brevundimonas sp.]